MRYDHPTAPIPLAPWRRNSRIFKETELQYALLRSESHLPPNTTVRLSSNYQKKPGPALLATSAKSDVIFSQKDLRVPTVWLKIGQAAISTRTRSSKLSKPDLPAALVASLLSSLEITRHSSRSKPHQHRRTTPTGLNGQPILH